MSQQPIPGAQPQISQLEMDLRSYIEAYAVAKSTGNETLLKIMAVSLDALIKNIHICLVEDHEALVNLISEKDKIIGELAEIADGNQVEVEVM